MSTFSLALYVITNMRSLRAREELSSSNLKGSKTASGVTLQIWDILEPLVQLEQHSGSLHLTLYDLVQI